MKTEQTNQRGGEAALVEQIASLQKQLDECLEVKQSDVKTADLNNKLEFVTNYLKSTLMGVWHIPDAADPTPWKTFREQIMSRPSLKPYLQDDDFLYGFLIMNKVIDRLDCVRLDSVLRDDEGDEVRDYEFGPAFNSGGTDLEWYFRMWQAIPYILLGVLNGSAADDYKRWEIARTYKAFRKLFDAFLLIPEAAFNFTDHEEVKIILECTIWCQKYLIDFKELNNLS